MRSDEDVSLGVRNGDGNWPGYHAAIIAEENLFPIASPVYLQTHGVPHSLDQLVHHTLVHLEEPFRKRPQWTDWFHAMGYPYRDTGDGLRLNDYALVIQAAIAGEGIAMGWKHIVERMLFQGILTRAYHDHWRSEVKVCLIWSSRVELSEQAATVRDWMIGYAGRINNTA